MFSLRSTKLALALALLAPLTACTQVFTSAPPASGPLSKAERWYIALGDSITVGYKNPINYINGHPYMAAQVMRTGVNNVATVGDQACDVVTRQIFNNGIMPTASLPTHYSLTVSTNDANVKGVGAYEGVFNSCHQAAIAWLGLPNEYKVLGTSATSTGSVQIDSALWQSCSTNGLGATCNFAFTVPVKPSTVYVWMKMIDGNAGVGTISLDGQLVQTYTTASTPAIATQNGITTGAALVRIPRVAAGAHSISVAQTSSTGNVGTIGVGWVPAAGFSTFSDVTVGTTPFQAPVNTGGVSTPAAVCQGALDSICQAYIADIRANVATLAGDGLDVRLFDTRQVMFATAAEMMDALHPNLIGQAELSRGLLDAMRPQTMGFPTSTANIFDQTAVVASSIISTTNGSVIGNYSGYTATDFMNLRGANSVEANFVFSMFKAGPAGIAFYDANKTFLSSYTNGWTNLYAYAGILVPPGAVYMRGWFVSSVNLATAMVITGPIMPTTYLPYTPAASN